MACRPSLDLQKDDDDDDDDNEPLGCAGCLFPV